MKNPEKALFSISVLCICAMLSGCASIKDELIIPPDPENPFQGTWSFKIGEGIYFHVIEGMSGTWYAQSSFGGLQKNAVYTIQENDNGEYITSNNWRISVDGDILTVENNRYERVKR
jgi:hypothetical protein